MVADPPDRGSLRLACSWQDASDLKSEPEGRDRGSMAPFWPPGSPRGRPQGMEGTSFSCVSSARKEQSLNPATSSDCPSCIGGHDKTAAQGSGGLPSGLKRTQAHVQCSDRAHRRPSTCTPRSGTMYIQASAQRSWSRCAAARIAMVFETDCGVAMRSGIAILPSYPPVN